MECLAYSFKPEMRSIQSFIIHCQTINLTSFITKNTWSETMKSIQNFPQLCAYALTILLDL